MGVKFRCSKCGDVIESYHVHDFKFCKCQNIFIDGGNDYTRFGGKALEDYSASFFEDGVWKPLSDIMKESYGVAGSTKIGLQRNSLENDMYIDIQNMSDMKHPIICDSSGLSGHLGTMKKVGKKQLYKYKFQNNCHGGKSSFGTEDFLIATSNCPILRMEGVSCRIGDLALGDEVMAISRNIHNLKYKKCMATFLISWEYYNEEVYNIEFPKQLCFVANGMFVKSI